MQKNAYFKGLTIPFLLLLPQLAITVVFFYWPASQAVWQSFLLEDAFGTSTEFVWFENYQLLFSDPGYLKAFINTVVFSTFVCVLSLAWPDGSIAARHIPPEAMEPDGGSDA